MMASDRRRGARASTRRSSAVDDLVDMCAEHALKPEEAVVAGFSGGGLAFVLALRRNDRPLGVLAMSPFSASTRRHGLEAARNMPVLLQHGTEDPM